MADQTCNNTTFGKMTYNHGWCRNDKISIFGNIYPLKILVAAYSGKPITDKQERAYRIFSKDKDKYLGTVGDALRKYVKNNNITASVVDDDELRDEVTPKTLLITQDGMVVLLLECKWDAEHGIGVELLPKVTVGSQDSFL